MSLLGLDSNWDFSLSLASVRALNSHRHLNDGFTRAILRALRDGPKRYPELVSHLGLQEEHSSRLRKLLRDLMALHLVAEKSGHRQLNKRRHVVLEHVTDDFLVHLDDTVYPWPDPWQLVILQCLASDDQKKALNAKHLFFQCPILSNQQARSVLERFAQNGWVFKHRTRVGKRIKIEHELNHEWWDRFQRDFKARLAYLQEIYKTSRVHEITIALETVPTFFLDRHRFQHFCVLTWLRHHEGVHPYVVDVQRALFLSVTRINSILKDLANLSLLEVYKTEQARSRRIKLNEVRVKSFLDCLALKDEEG